MADNENLVPSRNSFDERHEKLYNLLLEAIPSSVLLIDRYMCVVSANKNFMEKSLRRISNTIGQRVENIFPAVLLEHMDLINRIRQVFEKNYPVRGERITYRAPGVPIRIYYYSLLPFSWKARVENVLLLMEDITEYVRLSEEIRRMERHLASIVDSASDVILSTDTEGKVLTWNTAAENLSGYTFDEVKGRLFFELCSKAYQEEIKKVFSSLKGEKSSQMAEWDLLNKVDDSIPISWVCSSMKEDLSQARGIVAVGRDLTERHKFESQLRQSQKLAALGVMAGGIAHEIRNPLATCSSAAQFLMKDEPDPNFRKECAEKIQGGIRRISDIIENLLKFARSSPESGMVTVDLLSVLKETAALIANQLKIQKIEIKTVFPKAPIIIRGNTSLLQQVFMNLFMNALNAMANGGVLTVSVKKFDIEVLVKVADTGHGIPEQQVPKLFDPFYTTSSVKKGTGLGLSLCYSIIKQHLGSIEVNSVEGEGSTFAVRLPI